MIYEDIQIPNIIDKVNLLAEKEFSEDSLPPVYGAGKIKNPRIAFVFINPTYRNVSSSTHWGGLRAPWIGVRNIWKIFFEAGVISQQVFEKTQVTENWNEEFALDHYRALAKNGFYITNLVKWTGSNAKLPSGKMVGVYKDILREELTAISPKYTLAFGQLTFNSMVPSMRKFRFTDLIREDSFEAYDSENFKAVVPSYFPVGQGIKNWEKAVGTIRKVLEVA